MIILDDGSEELADLVPTDSRIRYQRMDRRYTMGAKHNMACAMARGEVVLHWDDDDWMANWRISYQLESLLAHPANTISGLAQLFFSIRRRSKHGNTSIRWSIGHGWRVLHFAIGANSGKAIGIPT